MEKETYSGFSSLSRKILIEIIGFFSETLTFISSLASEPLFSIFITLYTLILLYFPQIFLDLIFSPILISTGILLSTILRLGSIQRSEKQSLSALQHEDPTWVSSETDTETETESTTEMGVGTARFFCESFVEWNVRAPLEVIYEEYNEGEEENEREETRQVGIEELVSLSLYCSESDSGSSSDGEFPAIDEWDLAENMCFRWEEEIKEGLIEIALDGKRSLNFQVEEENLIEIDLSMVGDPVDNDSFPTCVRFT